MVFGQIYSDSENPRGKTPVGIIPEQVIVCPYERFLCNVFGIFTRDACFADKAEYLFILPVHQQTETLGAAIQHQVY